MTIEEFDSMNFTYLDTVDILMKDGTLRREFLYQGHAYSGMPQKVSYPDGLIIPARPPQIVILGDSILGTAGIPLEDVEDVTLVARVP